MDQKIVQKIEQKWAKDWTRNRTKKVGPKIGQKNWTKDRTKNQTNRSVKKLGKKSDKKIGQEIGRKFGQVIGQKNRTEKIRQRNLTKNRTNHQKKSDKRNRSFVFKSGKDGFFFWIGGGGRLTLTVTDPKVPFWLDSNFEGLVVLKQVLLLGFRYRRGSQLTMQAWCNGRNRDMRLTEGTWVEFPSFGMFYIFKRDFLI